MRTTRQFIFSFLTIRLRITATILGFSLLLGLTLWGLERSVKVKASTPPIGAESGYLYVLSECFGGCANRIFGFAVDETTGALTPLPGFPILTSGNGGNGFTSELLTIDRKNLRLFAINDGSDTVSAYTIDPSTGKLTEMSFSPINLPVNPINPNTSPVWSTIATRPSGSDSLLLIGDQGSRMASFKIAATTAAAAPGSPFGTGLANPLSTTFSQDGAFVYTGGGNSQRIAGFRIDANGVLTTLNGSAFDAVAANPAAYATDADGRLFVANRPFQQLRVFTTTPDGIPTLVSPTFSPTGLQHAGQGLVHPRGFYLVSDRFGTGVGVHQIVGKGSATSLTKVSGSPFTSGGSGVNLLALNQSGTFLFAANSNTRNITTFQVNLTTGVLDNRGTQPADTLGTQFGLFGIAYLPPRTTTMTIDAPAITCGQDGTVTVNVNSPAGNPTGDVTLTVDGGAPMTQPLIGDPSATFTIPAPALGSHALAAAFSAQNGFTAISATGTLVVNAAATTVTIDAPAISCGQDGTVVVNVSSPAGNPTGEVRLQVDGVESSQTLSGGSATFIINAPDVGTHPLVATYSAQACFASSSSLPATLSVNLSSTTATIEAPGITFGQQGSVTVRVSSPDGNPTGEVKLKVDGVERSQTLSGGSATFIINAPTVGTHTLRATFPAQGCFESKSADGTLVVRVARTGTTIDALGIVFGQNGTVIVKVVSLFARPSGNVMLRVDGGAAMTGVIADDGSATFTIPTPALGDRVLRATFPAQGGFAASVAKGVLMVTKGRPTSTHIHIPPVTLGFTSTQTALVSVKVSSIFSEPPSGEVLLTLDNRPPMTQTLTNGSATFNIVVPAAGPHFLRADFPAQAGFAGSHSPLVPLILRGTVSQETTTTINAPAVTFGEKGRVIVTVKAVGTTPSGNVSLTVGTGGTAVTKTLTVGKATFLIKRSRVGSHLLLVRFTGTAAFQSSNAIGILVVNPPTVKP